MPFFDSKQMSFLRTPLDAMNGNHGEQSCIQAFGAVDIVKDGATWKILNRTVSGSGGEYVTLSDQNFYVPDFRVAAISVGIIDPALSPNGFYSVHYDLPYPNPRLYRPSDAETHPALYGNWDWFTTGSKSPIFITRIRFTTKTTATKITLWR